MFHFDDGARNDFEQGDYHVYPMLDTDVGDLTHIVFSLTAEGSYAGEVSLNAAAEFRAVSGSIDVASVEKWGSGHNSPMWKLDHAKVVCFNAGMETTDPVFAIRSATFSADRWIGAGNIVKISSD